MLKGSKVMRMPMSNYYVHTQLLPKFKRHIFSGVDTLCYNAMKQVPFIQSFLSCYLKLKCDQAPAVVYYLTWLWRWSETCNETGALHPVLVFLPSETKMCSGPMQLFIIWPGSGVGLEPAMKQVPFMQSLSSCSLKISLTMQLFIIWPGSGVVWNLQWNRCPSSSLCLLPTWN